MQQQLMVWEQLAEIALPEPERAAERQLASVQHRIAELQDRKASLQQQIFIAHREVELKSRLLQNAVIREQELRNRA